MSRRRWLRAGFHHLSKFESDAASTVSGSKTGPKQKKDARREKENWDLARLLGES